MTDIPAEDKAVYWAHRKFLGRTNVKFNPNADRPQLLEDGAYDVLLQAKEQDGGLNIWFDRSDYQRVTLRVREHWPWAMKTFRRLCEETGLREKYEAGEVEAADIEGKSVRVTVQRDGKYVNMVSVDATAVAPDTTPNDSEIPF